MQSVFKFKKGAVWDGDEYVIHWIEDKITARFRDAYGYLIIKKDVKVTVIIESLNEKKETSRKIKMLGAKK